MTGFYYVYRATGRPDENDIAYDQIAYATYEEAARFLDPWVRYQKEDILRKIGDRWYSVAKNQDGQLIYWDIHSSLYVSWHTQEEIERGVDLNNIPFENLVAMAAATAYRNGTLADGLTVRQEDLYDYGFYDKFTEYFGKEIIEFGV